MNSLEIIEKCFTIFLSICLLINAIVIKKKTNSWLVPGSLCSLFWFVFTFFPLVFLFNIPIKFYGQLFITTSVILFSWTFRFFDWKKFNNSEPKQLITYSKFRLTGFLIISVSFSIIALITHLTIVGLNVVDILFSPVKSATVYSKLRYLETIDEAFFNFLCLIFCYISVLVGSYIYILDDKRKFRNLIVLVSFLPATAIMLTQSAKGAFFLCLFLFLGNIYICKHYKRAKFKFHYRHLLKFSLSAVFLFALVTISLLSRGLNTAKDMSVFFSDLIKLLSYYTMSHLYAFSNWIQSFLGYSTKINYDVSSNNYGYYTFNFFTRYFFPDKTYVRGIYNEYFTYGNIIETNVYTIFRGLIMDFGILGSILLTLLLGFLVHKIYYLFLKGMYPFITYLLMVFFIAFLGTSFLASILTWTVIPITFCLYGIILFLCQKRNHKQLITTI